MRKSNMLGRDTSIQMLSKAPAQILATSDTKNLQERHANMHEHGSEEEETFACHHISFQVRCAFNELLQTVKVSSLFPATVIRTRV
jgi:hypothetical protein